MANITESIVEEATLAWLEALGYSVLNGPDIAAGEPGAESSDPNCRDAMLDGRLRRALFHLNPDLPYEALEDAYRKLMRISGKLRVADPHRFSSDTKRPTEGTRTEQ